MRSGINGRPGLLLRDTAELTPSASHYELYDIDSMHYSSYHAVALSERHPLTRNDSKKIRRENRSGLVKMPESPSSPYVHGYSSRESLRLHDQATILYDLLHADTVYPANAHVLEAGCGTGAQTVYLAARNPGARFTSIDISESSLEKARSAVRERGLSNVVFQQTDIFNMPFSNDSFDHVFICFVLEHLAHPIEVLARLCRVIAPGGTITVVEGDHGSAYFHPESVWARKAIQCLVELQARKGGDALIGRRLYPLLTTAGFREVTVAPRIVYVDDSKSEWADGFTKKTFTAMVEGVGPEVLASGLMDKSTWMKGISDLYATSAPGGTFCYTFFKGRGIAS
jgi:ubiquinone/menaquinone biosynthesis C-methylase UbiE